MSQFHHRITARDIALFKKLIECRAMTTHQIQPLLFPGPSPSRCILRLKFLFDAGFLGRLEQPSILSEGKKPYVYVPKLPAVQLVAQIEGKEPDEVESKELVAGYPFLAHILEITEVNIRIAIACQTGDYSLASWLNELSLKRRGMVERFEMHNLSSVRQTVSLIPDASFVVTTKERPFRFLLEVDKGTEILKDIEMKMVKYRHYFNPSEASGTSLYQQRYGVSGGRVLFVAPSPARLSNLKTVCEKCGGTSRYWFALLADIQTHNPLTHPIWRKAGSDDLFGLF